jgi:hypothetical protein
MRSGRALEQMKAEVAALKLPHTVPVALPKDLGSDEMWIEIRARNGTEFRDSLRALSDSADGVELIMDLLDGQEPEQDLRQSFQTELS